jgi:hypothetical protein
MGNSQKVDIALVLLTQKTAAGICTADVIMLYYHHARAVMEREKYYSLDLTELSCECIFFTGNVGVANTLEGKIPDYEQVQN